MDRLTGLIRISEATAAGGLSIATIRYHESAVTLPWITHRADGRRVFTTADVE